MFVTQVSQIVINVFQRNVVERCFCPEQPVSLCKRQDERRKFLSAKHVCKEKFVELILLVLQALTGCPGGSFMFLLNHSNHSNLRHRFLLVSLKNEQK